MRRILLFAVLFSFSFITKAQNQSWQVNPTDEKFFIKNAGQFDNYSGEKVHYVFDGPTQKYIFTDKGLVIKLEPRNKRVKSAEEKEARGAKKKEGFVDRADFINFEMVGNRVDEKSDILEAFWLGANSEIEIIGESKNDYYHNYGYYNSKGEELSAEKIPSFKKVIYRNVYPNIDVVYEFHQLGGLKYSIIVRPGGDLSKIKLQYSKPFTLNADGTIRTSTSFGEIMDHTPLTFYKNNKSEIIDSKYVVDNGVISFLLGNHDELQTIVIDPWTQTPNFANTNWNSVWECERDAAGNVYIIGGTSPLQLIKYNSAGTIQWTVNTPYDTTEWLGTFAVDNAGNSYVANGSTAHIIKYNTAGGTVWNNPNPGGIFTSTEFWNITFNCDQTKLVVGGTGGFLPPLPYVYDVDLNSGNITASVQVTGGELFPTQEVRAITACGNGKYYWLSHDSLGYVHQSLTGCTGSNTTPTYFPNGYSFSYKCENFRYNNSGIMALAYFNNFIFVHRGNELHKRDFNTGAVLATVAIPGGTFTSGFGGSAVGCSGIDIDDCGNIYVGSTNGVYVFNQSLTQTGSFPTSYNVYDVEVNIAGDIVACGSTGNSSNNSRTGSVQVFAAGACAPQATICCDATVCPPPMACTTDGAFSITAITPGGTWSASCGSCINASTGVFDPAISGQGAFSVTYTIACGSETQTVYINDCTPLAVCLETNGTMTVSGGTGPYNWYEFFPASSTPITTEQECLSCNSNYSWLAFFNSCMDGAFFVSNCNNAAGYDYFATGTNATPGSNFPIQVQDFSGQTYTINSLGDLLPCTACPTVTVTVSNQVNVLCNGASTGSFDASSAGGTGPYDYTLLLGATTISTFSNVAGTQSFTGLAAGTYTLDVVDDNGCPGTTTIIITENPIITITETNNVASTCGNPNGSSTVSASGGAGSFTYSWNTSPVQTGATATGLVAGPYIVTATDGSGCTQTLAINIANTGGPSVSVSSQTDPTCNGGTDGSITVLATGGTGSYTYSWSPSGGTAATASGLSANTYTVTVDDGGGCPTTATVTLNNPTAITITETNNTAASCGNNNGSSTVSASGGTGTITYSWNTSPVQTGATASGLAGGSYDVTATDASGCTQILTISISNTGGPTLSITSQTDPLCAGGLTGEATVLATGGTGTISYSWSPSGGNAATATGLGAGTYTVTATDANSCTGTTIVTITDPATLSVTTSSTDATCGQSDGSLTAVGSGGTGTLSYSWNTSPVQNTATATGVPAGAYSVTVTDANGCTVTASQSVNNTGAPVISLVNQTDVTCNGDTDGAATVSATGTGSLTFSWNTSPVQTGTTVSGLAAGSYVVTVTDGGGCTATLSVIITEPGAVTGVATSTAANCSSNDGTASVVASGGDGNYSYAWTGGGTTASISGLAPGSYDVTITDGNGCTGTATTIVGTVNTASIYAGPDVIIAAGSSTTLNASGGISYVWTPATGLSCTNCASPDASPTTTTVYIVTGTDASGCVGSDTVIVFVEAPCGELWVPTAFSPNGDGSNEELCVYGGCIQTLIFQLYDRWGEMVFETSDNSICWDGVHNGKKMNSAVFVYYLKAILSNGEEVELKGNITLVR